MRNARLGVLCILYLPYNLTGLDVTERHPLRLALGNLIQKWTFKAQEMEDTIGMAAECRCSVSAWRGKVCMPGISPRAIKGT